MRKSRENNDDDNDFKSSIASLSLSAPYPPPSMTCFFLPFHFYRCSWPPHVYIYSIYICRITKVVDKLERVGEVVVMVVSDLPAYQSPG